MISPFERAALWHIRHCPGTSFRDVVEAHFQCGHVISGPDLFILGRRVHHDWPDDRLRDPWDTDPRGDAWHVWLCAGIPATVLPLIPCPLAYVTFHRRGRLVRYPFQRLVRSVGAQ